MYKKILLEGDVPVDHKTHIQLYSPQSSDIVKTNPPRTFKILNVKTTFLGLGAATLVRMDGFTKIRLLTTCAVTEGQTGIATIDIFNQTDNISLVSLSFSDYVIQEREAVASISMIGIKRLYARLMSTVYSDDIEMGEISIQLER